MDIDIIIRILNDIFGNNVATIILSVIGFCAVVAAQLPGPNKETTWGKVYAPVYALLQWFGQNYRKAKNASDVAQSPPK
jgi:hypothetical protein